MSAELPDWILGPVDLAAVRADEQLLERLAAGGEPDPDDVLGAHLAAWLREVKDGGTR